MSNYFVMKGDVEAPIVLLYSIKDPGERNCWMWGRPFTTAVRQPVEAIVIPDNDQGVLMPFYNTPQIMRKDVYAALQSAGVNNVEVYRAIVKTEAGVVVSDDYLAYNIVGLVKAVDIPKSQFAPENPSRMADASIEKLALDESRTSGLLIFRLAESFRLVVVHRCIKDAIEARGIPGIVFLGGENYLF